MAVVRRGNDHLRIGVPGVKRVLGIIHLDRAITVHEYLDQGLLIKYIFVCLYFRVIYCKPKLYHSHFPHPYRSEEIPLEDFQHSRNSSPIARGSPSSNTPSRSHTPSRVLCDPISISPRLTSGTSDMNSLAPNGVSVMIAKEAATNSEETSFIAREEKEKRRGGVETV